MYFILLVVVGNYIILNLFLAILLDNFGGGDDEEEEEEEEEEVAVEAKKTDANLPSTTYNSFIKDADGKLGKSASSGEAALGGGGGPPGGSSPANSKALGMEYSSLFIFSPSNPVRVLAARITTHKYFEYIIIVLIVLSSILLAMDGPNLAGGSFRTSPRPRCERDLPYV